MKSPARTLTPELLHKIDAYWRAANYLSAGQIFLYDNPLLKRPLTLADVKKMLLGHWGTTPGQNFIYAHLNRVIKKYDLDMIYVSGPGHGGPAVVCNTYLEGTYSEADGPEARSSRTGDRARRATVAIPPWRAVQSSGRSDSQRIDRRCAQRIAPKCLISSLTCCLHTESCERCGAR